MFINVKITSPKFKDSSQKPRSTYKQQYITCESFKRIKSCTESESAMQMHISAHESSEIFISDKINKNETDLSGNMKVSVEFIAGAIEGDANAKLTKQEEDIHSNTIFKIHGTLKKTIFATSFKSLKTLIEEIKANPDEYLSEKPQDFFDLSDILNMSIRQKF